MGLDVTAYRRLTKLDAVYDADGEPIDPITRETIGYDLYAFVNPDFPGSADELEHRAVYSAADSHHFRAGSYSGYNRWREGLAEIAGYPLGEYDKYGRKWPSHCIACWNGATGPFSELINFSDCEGVIGAAVSAKLAKDFADFQPHVDALERREDYFSEEFVRFRTRFRSLYAEFRKAFEMAADGGAVAFH